MKHKQTEAGLTEPHFSHEEVLAELWFCTHQLGQYYVTADKVWHALRTDSK